MKRRRNGFALLELIVTLTLLAALSAMVVPYFLAGITKGTDPLDQMGTPLALQAIMGRMIADYTHDPTYLNNPTAFSARIVNGNYGLTAANTITKNSNYKFDATDTDTALLVTIKDNASGQTVTYIFTKQL